jgi:hypothetical protein
VLQRHSERVRRAVVVHRAIDLAAVIEAMRVLALAALLPAHRPRRRDRASQQELECQDPVRVMLMNEVASAAAVRAEASSDRWLPLVRVAAAARLAAVTGHVLLRLQVQALATDLFPLALLLH